MMDFGSKVVDNTIEQLKLVKTFYEEQIATETAEERKEREVKTTIYDYAINHLEQNANPELSLEVFTDMAVFLDDQSKTILHSKVIEKNLEYTVDAFIYIITVLQEELLSEHDGNEEEM